MKLENKTALITGTSRGIGKAIAEEFACEGANVIAHARKETPEFAAWCADLAAKNSITVTPVYFDVTDSAAMKAAVRSLVTQKIPVNILVNNAGVPHGGLLTMTPMQKIREVFDVNFFAVLGLTQQLARYMQRCGGGSVVNLSSVFGLDLHAGNSAYGVSKAAIAAWTRVMAEELGLNGIRVNAVAPGLIATDITGFMDEKVHQAMVDHCGLRRGGTVEEVARVVAFLASDNASFVNGQIIRIDGRL